MDRQAERASLLRSAEHADKQAAELRQRARSFDRPVRLYEVAPEQVGTPHPLGGRWLGCDVGKRVYLNCDVLQVENDDQLRARLAKGT